MLLIWNGLNKPQEHLPESKRGYQPHPVPASAQQHLSKQLVASARKHPSVQALVFTSTAHVVRLTPKHNSRPVREDEVPLHSLQSGPHAYTRTKSAIDILVRENNTPEAFENTSGDFTDQLLTAVLRVTGMYGPRDRQTILEMLKVANTFKTQFQLGPNKLVHDWIYVESCAQAHVLAAKVLLNPRTKRADGEAFSVSDGKPMKFWDFVRKVWEEWGDANWAPDGSHKVSAVIPIWLILFAVGTIEWAYWLFTFGMLRSNSTWITYEYMKDGCWFDIGKAREVLGYEPMCDTAEGVRRSIQWHKDNPEWGKKLQ